MYKLFFVEDQAENIPKKNERTAKNPGERMYVDISSIKDESHHGRKHWAMLVDEDTRCKHSFSLKKNQTRWVWSVLG